MAKNKKTNAMRLLEHLNIDYNSFEYEVIDGKTDGLTVAKSVGQNPDMVFKTLVTRGLSRDYYVFVVPVAKELNLKKAAKVTNEKKVEMIPMKDLLPITGYIHGGCSPVGMKKPFATFIHESVKDHDTMICSGGKRGMQIQVKVEDMLRAIGAQIEDIC